MLPASTGMPTYWYSCAVFVVANEQQTVKEVSSNLRRCLP